MKKLIRISASDYTPHLIKVSPTDKKYILDKLNKSHKTLGDLGSAGDPGYYISEFEDAAYGLWSSDKGLKILDDAGIAYEEVKKAITSSANPFYDKLSDYDKRIVDSQLRSKYPYQIVSMAAILRDHMDLVDKAYKDATHKKLTDIADSLYNVGLDPTDMFPEYSQLYARMGKEYFDKVLDDMYAIDSQLTSDDKVQELVDDYYDRIGNITASTKVTAATRYDTDVFSPDTFDVYNALLPYIGEYSSATGWVGACELKKVADDTTVDGYNYKVIWDDHDVDIFSWKINDNPRVGGDFTLMIMPAHGMPMFCDSEKDFYRAVRKVFGDGLKKIN